MAGEREELLRWLTGMLQQFAAQLGDPGEVVTAKVDGAGEEAAAEVDDDRRWVAVWLQSVVDGRRRFLGRLLSPGGLLWWLPEQGEIGAMLRSGNLTGALTTYFLGGHGGAANRVPSWLSSSVVGLYARAGKTLRVDAEDGDVAVTAGAKVKLQGGGRRAAGEGHAVAGGTLTGTVMVGGAPVAVQFTYTPPGGVAGAPGPSATLRGSIDEGSDEVEIDS